MRIDIVVVYVRRYARGHERDFVPSITGIHLAGITPAGHEVRVVEAQQAGVAGDVDVGGAALGEKRHLADDVAPLHARELDARGGPRDAKLAVDLQHLAADRLANSRSPPRLNGARANAACRGDGERGSTVGSGPRSMRSRSQSVTSRMREQMAGLSVSSSPQPTAIVKAESRPNCTW
jgi:hypothetical protein